jgi:hypothetical protein
MLDSTRWKTTQRLMIVVQTDPYLPQIVRTGRTAGGLSGCLNSRQEEGGQQPDYGNHHK